MQEAEKTLLKVEHLQIGFRERKKMNVVVKDVSFSVKEGEILGIVGESGSGKSMTALSILGLLSKEAKLVNGNIIFEDKELYHCTKKEFCKIRGNDISMIFQEPMTSLNPVMKIGSQIEEMLLLHSSINETERKQKVLDILEEAGLQNSELLIGKYPHQLSGGMRQRVMIAMAMVMKPKLLIADEPTTALDVTVQEQILKLIQRFNKEYKTAVIFISHDLGIIKNLCHRAIVMCNGFIEEEGSIQKIFENPESEYTKKLLSAVPGRDRINQFEQQEDEIQAASITEQKQALEVKQLNGFYLEQKNLFGQNAKKKILDNISFSVAQGEIVGIVGESGCGKSTLAKAVLGLLEQTEGTIHTFGERPAMVFQDPFSSLNPTKKIKWLMEEPLKLKGGFSKQQRQQKIMEMLKEVGLEEEHMNRYVSELSGGQRQRVSIACALITNSRLVVLDEPVSALDVTIQAQILKLLLKLRKTFDLSYVFISHDLNVVYQMCDRICVMYQGKMIEIAERQELFENPKEEYTRKLLSAIPWI
ncbi:dipeptide ABC transporter ATP-binding protein [Anaeromicropila populeti]|uniref:Peptide/nickel transport system ATP-binding protein n=1 Tax=Anaeromicropila populeti TaxID=37658 RepID=A0A1I6HUB3_9FIRM|nr:ABC transporter ATP-binding protein [Anaeromicropila populeti]SFR58013.1 peptide/nickel transport system ATP-binding protein [Anaeromicropila populeti]